MVGGGSHDLTQQWNFPFLITDINRDNFVPYLFVDANHASVNSVSLTSNTKSIDRLFTLRVLSSGKSLIVSHVHLVSVASIYFRAPDRVKEIFVLQSVILCVITIRLRHCTRLLKDCVVFYVSRLDKNQTHKRRNGLPFF